MKKLKSQPPLMLVLVVLLVIKQIEEFICKLTLPLEDCIFGPCSFSALGLFLKIIIDY